MTWERIAQNYAAKMYRKRMHILAGALSEEQLKKVEQEEADSEGTAEDAAKQAEQEIAERNYYKRWRGGFTG